MHSTIICKNEECKAQFGVKDFPKDQDRICPQCGTNNGKEQDDAKE